MVAVIGYSKQYYIDDCINHNGKVVSFASLEEAISFMKKKYNVTTDDAKNSILNDTNCDWIVFEDNTVIFRNYSIK